MLREFLRREKTSLLDGQIDVVLRKMKTEGVDSEDYPKLMGYLERLHELRQAEMPEPLSRETMALIFGNLAGILLIVAFERTHVIASKAISQIKWPR